jgi:hypothetical protein
MSSSIFPWNGRGMAISSVGGGRGHDPDYGIARTASSRESPRATAEWGIPYYLAATAAPEARPVDIAKETSCLTASRTSWSSGAMTSGSPT